MRKTLIIAEVGVNHNGDIELAKQLIEEASNAGADIVKFQTFNSENLTTHQAEKANYQKNIFNENESQQNMLKKLELSEEQYLILKEYCIKYKIEFLSTAFDNKSIEFLSKLNMQRYKIPSGEITNLQYLKKIASFRKDIILSTGMASLGEIEKAISVIEGEGMNRENLTVLHCTTEYPTSMEAVNLRAMHNIKKAFSVSVGYSDHTLGIEVPIAAVSLGASIIEKHITLDRSFNGPDHKASIEPDEFKQMVNAIRNIEIALGDGIKRPTKGELKNMKIARKSIVASRDINAGEKFSIPSSW